jgi:hypothetical protein
MKASLARSRGDSLRSSRRPLVSIASSSLRRCKNFDQILKVIGRNEFQRGKTLSGLRDMRYHRQLARTLSKLAITKNFNSC